MHDAECTTHTLRAARRHVRDRCNTRRRCVNGTLHHAAHWSSGMSHLHRAFCILHLCIVHCALCSLHEPPHLPPLSRVRAVCCRRFDHADTRSSRRDSGVVQRRRCGLPRRSRCLLLGGEAAGRDYAGGRERRPLRGGRVQLPELASEPVHGGAVRKGMDGIRDPQVLAGRCSLAISFPSIRCGATSTRPTRSGRSARLTRPISMASTVG